MWSCARESAAPWRSWPPTCCNRFRGLPAAASRFPPAVSCGHLQKKGGNLCLAGVAAEPQYLVVGARSDAAGQRKRGTCEFLTRRGIMLPEPVSCDRFRLRREGRKGSAPKPIPNSSGRHVRSVKDCWSVGSNVRRSERRTHSPTAQDVQMIRERTGAEIL